MGQYLTTVKDATERTQEIEVALNWIRQSERCENSLPREILTKIIVWKKDLENELNAIQKGVDHALNREKSVRVEW